MSNINVQLYAVPVEELYASIADISANVSFIHNELPSFKLTVPEELYINQACEEFQSAISDARKEVRNLEDKLGMHPDQPPFDPNIKNPDPRVTMGFISNWLWNEIEVVHQIVKELERLSKTKQELDAVYILVSESATNILNAYIKLKKSLDFIAEKLENIDA